MVSACEKNEALATRRTVTGQQHRFTVRTVAAISDRRMNNGDELELTDRDRARLVMTRHSGSIDRPEAMRLKIGWPSQFEHGREFQRRSETAATVQGHT